MKNQAYAIVSRSQGSWKWQPRFALHRYESYITKDNRIIWKFAESCNEFVKKTDIPYYRMNYHAVLGGLHNKPVKQ